MQPIRALSRDASLAHFAEGTAHWNIYSLIHNSLDFHVLGANFYNFQMLRKFTWKKWWFKTFWLFLILMMYLIRTTKNWSNNHRVFTDCTDFSQNLNAGSKTTQCPQVNGPNHEVKRVSRGFFQQDSAKVMSEIEGKCEI